MKIYALPTIKFCVNRNYHVKDEEIQAVKCPCTCKRCLGRWWWSWTPPFFLKKKKHTGRGSLSFFGHPAAEPSCLCFEDALLLRAIPLLSSFKCSLIKLKMLLLYLASLKLGGRLTRAPGWLFSLTPLRTDLGFTPDVNIPNLTLLKESLWTAQYLYLFKHYILIIKIIKFNIK